MYVQRDLPCRKCSYNLRGLDPEQHCPECGTALAFSLRNELLIYSEPAYVRSLASGANLLLWSVLLPFVLNLVLGSNAAWVEALGAVLGLVAAWQLTNPDPSGLGEDQYGRWRRLARGVALWGFGAYLAQAIIPMLLGTSLLLVILESLLSLGLGVAYIFMLMYIERLGQRLSGGVAGETIGRRARRLKILTIIFHVLVFFTVMVVVLPAGLIAALAVPLTFAGIFLAILAVSIGVLWLMLVWRLRKSLMVDVGLAEKLWNREPVLGSD